MLNNIKQWSYQLRSRFGTYRLLKEMKQLKREHRFINIEDARKIGFLFNASDAAALREIQGYIQRIATQKKEVVVLGYIEKDTPENPLKKLGYSYFTRKNVNWLLIPNDTGVKEFTYSNFDILICVDNENCFPLQYISAMSKAVMRVGKYSEGNVRFYDLMINQKNNDLKSYFDQVDHYLNLINVRNA
jgi:hypothetical protein